MRVIAPSFEIMPVNGEEILKSIERRSFWKNK